MLKSYLVGGAVRDKVLDIQNSDKDYVVVGSTEQEMLNLGFVKVGAAFPVFFWLLLFSLVPGCPKSGTKEFGAAQNDFRFDIHPESSSNFTLRKQQNLAIRGSNGEN